MSDRTAIAWTEATWSPVTGCTRISSGCDNCYIERTPPFRMTHRQFDHPGTGGTTGVTLHPDRLDQPHHWRKPRRIFVCSMADLFHDNVPDEHIAAVWVTMMLTPRHTYQVLTKRHARLRTLLSSPDFPRLVAAAARHRWDRDARLRAALGWVWTVDGTTPRVWPLPNVWVGVSAEDQQWADIRITALLRTPAAVRWVSAEPLLGPLELRHHLTGHCTLHDFAGGYCVQRHHPGVQHLHWVVAGGESGPGARPMHPDWVRKLRDDCASWHVPFFFKQWGAWAPPEQCGVHNGRVANNRWQYESTRFRADGTRYDPTAHALDEVAGYGAPSMESLLRVGAKQAGRTLDGQIHDDYPQVVAP